MEKTIEKIYPLVTGLVIVVSLAQAAILPLWGALNAAFALIILTAKLFFGGTVGKTEEATKARAAAQGSANFWGQVIAYLSTPMDQAEKICLTFGWVLLPIAASIPVAIFLGLTKYICESNLLDQTICAVAKNLF